MILKNSILVLGLFYISCGYYSTKGSIPTHIKSISFESIINETSEYYISDNFEETLLNMFINKNILKVKDINFSDSHIYIKIKSFSDMPFSYSSDDNSTFEDVEEYKVVIAVEAKWYDMIDKTTLFEKTFTNWGIYALDKDISYDQIDNDGDGKIDDEDLDELGSAREAAIRIAIHKISEDIIEAVLLTW